MGECLSRESREIGAVCAASPRREEGSVVTYSVAIFMLVALLVYLVMAYFADEPAPGEVEAPTPSAESGP